MPSKHPGTFQISREEQTAARQILERKNQKALSLHDLIVDNYSLYWLEIINFLNSHVGLGKGKGERIAIIDTGYSEEAATQFRIDRSKSLDLTGEGPGDKPGHGSAISTLIGLTAPAADQFHVKLLDSSHTIPGQNYSEQVERIKAAFNHVESVGATMVNISWNYLTGYKEHAPHDYRPGNFCSCPICQILTTFVQRTEVDVFVSEGNYFGAAAMPESESKSKLINRSHGDYSCPAAAPLVVPVIGFREGETRYSPNLDTTCGVPAPSSIRIAPGKVELTGTSFATPLVVGTYAAFKSALRELGFPPLSIPHSFEGEPNTTPYNFSLELLFVSPEDAGTERRSLHTEWKVFVYNTTKCAQKQYDKGKADTAGELCCFVANLMTIPYKRMEKWEFGIPIGQYILDLFINGISLLHQSKFASTAFDQFGKARNVIDIMRDRGLTSSDQVAAIDRLEQEHIDNQLQFLLRM